MSCPTVSLTPVDSVESRVVIAVLQLCLVGAVGGVVLVATTRLTRFGPAVLVTYAGIFATLAYTRSRAPGIGFVKAFVGILGASLIATAICVIGISMDRRRNVVPAG